MEKTIQIEGVEIIIPDLAPDLQKEYEDVLRRLNSKTSTNYIDSDGIEKENLDAKMVVTSLTLCKCAHEDCGKTFIAEKKGWHFYGDEQVCGIGCARAMYASDAERLQVAK